MEQRAFGSTGLKVSVLGLGASHVGNYSVSDEDAEVFLNEALDLGVTLLDTAVSYGHSEERIGRYLKHRRSEFIISTKGGYGVEGVADWTPECIRLGVDQALHRLQTDHIDIMHFHSCPLETLQRDDVVAALLLAVEQGKVRVAAYSGENSPRSYAIRCGAFGSIQSSLNICDQQILDSDLPAMVQEGLGFIAKRPIANAFWRFTKHPDSDYSAVYWDRAHTMGLAPPPGMEWAEFALRFSAFQPGVSSCIVGTANLDHFRANLSLVRKGPLPADVLESTRNLFKKHGTQWFGQV